ncbi:MAG TPA: class D sortase [Xanthomonadaceae bacterium]|nr:class D sortase [Xanthomonadaceae bacterium]
MTRWDPSASVELACWLIGIGLILLFFAARVSGDWQHDRALVSFGEARVAAKARTEVPAIPAFDPLADEGVEPLAASGAPDPAPDSGDTSALPIAVLRIASIELQVPVFADTSERNLNRGAGWVEGTAPPHDIGNMAIAGHRDRHFRPLKDVAVGDVVVLESLTGERSYRVTTLAIVEPEDVSSLAATEDAAVTLITCYPFHFIGNAPQRFIVRALAMD